MNDETKELTEDEKKLNKMQEDFAKKKDAFQADLKGLAEKHDVGLLVAVHFTEFGAVGLETQGKLSPLEEGGMALAFKNKYQL